MENLIQRFQVFLINNRTPLTIIVGLIIVVFLALFLGSYQKEIKTAKQKVEKKAKSKTTALWLRNVYFFTVEKLKKLPMVGDAIRNMSYTNQCQFAISDEDAMMLVGKFLTLAILGAVIGGVIAFIYFEDIIIMIIIAILFGIIAGNTVKLKPVKFLVAMQDAIDDFIHSYHEHSGNIDQAFFDIINSNSLVAGHFNVMYEYIKKADISQNPEEIQKEYNQLAPSRILRNFYAVVYMTYKYGDTIIDGKSAFSTNVYQIQDTISSDLYELESLQDGTFGESAFIIVSIFMLPMVEWYMVNYFNFEGFEYVQQFMSSVIGYVVKIFCSATAFICFMMYQRLTNLNVLESRKAVSWETKLLHNYNFRSIVNFVSPPAKRGPLQDKMLRCGSNETVVALTCKRIILTVAVAVICAIAVLFNIQHSASSFLNDPYQGLTEESYTDSVVMYADDMDQFLADNIVVDKQVINYLNANYPFFLMEAPETQQELYQEALDETGLSKGSNDLNYVLKTQDNQSQIFTRIVSKMTMIQETKGLYNILFWLAAVVIAFYMPVFMVQVQSVLNKESMLQSETADLQRMTLMLIQHSTCSPEQLLNWYTNSTMLFSRQFHEASITRDLKALSASIGYKPFTQLMSCLDLSLTNHMALDEAFSGIEQKMRIQEKEQQRKIQKLTKFRVNAINMLTTICLGAVIGLYMFIPMAISMLQMFGDMGFSLS